MSRTILSLILAFSLLSCISAVSGAPDAYANDFIKKFAGKYYNSTNTTTAEDKNATDAESAAPNPACAQTLNKTNDAIAQFAESVGTAKDKWSLLGSISRLSGQSYSLGFNCKPEDLKLVNSGEAGVNKTQDEACDKLIEIIQPLLIKSKDAASATSGFEQSLALSQKALGISKKLGDKCQVSLIDTTQKVPEEEGEVEVEAEEEEIEEEEATLEESINEELEEEEEESYDLIVQVVDEEGNLETIYYGFPDVEIDLDADIAEESVEQEAEEEEEEAEEEEEEEEVSTEASLINFVQTKTSQNKPNPNPNPNPWSSVDYQGKYSTGGAGGNYTALNAF